MSKAVRMSSRDAAFGLIGVELGAAIGLLGFSTTVLAPVGLAAAGGLAGLGASRARHVLIRRWLRAQLRAGRPLR